MLAVSLLKTILNYNCIHKWFRLCPAENQSVYYFLMNSLYNS